jgi:hypothetical protein
MVLVVTDDRDLRARLHRKGARTAGAQWLIGRLERLTVGAVGRQRPPPTPPHVDQEPAHEERRWTPGRGATTKRGNPDAARTARRTGPSNRG